ncbi:hypothetical protein LX32DRAFT_437883 [Colletotrichum zoysiae]|uniref:Uncharacterized protein n=1 Tax=Colletotrichum zoysiae TaxID=1216348 RepID=A0AAD9HFT5_9PEZI|nr:hypothetical protein LX32DRAFT_437883 [Colletotrichum zoysiae]
MAFPSTLLGTRPPPCHHHHTYTFFSETRCSRHSQYRRHCIALPVHLVPPVCDTPLTGGDSCGRRPRGILTRRCRAARAAPGVAAIRGFRVWMRLDGC